VTLAALLKTHALVKGRLAKQPHLLRLCASGRLSGGLAVHLHTGSDEAFGGVTYAMGGAARQLRLDDVRGHGPLELVVVLGSTKERWEVADVPGLVHNLNSFFARDESVKKGLVLGQWEDAWQLWFLPPAKLFSVMASGLVFADNARVLARQLMGEDDV
jgi:hypothetical protein